MITRMLLPRRIDCGRRAACDPGTVTVFVDTRAARDDRRRGGDVFDLFERADGSSTILLADVSSKGALGQAQANMVRKRFRESVRTERSPGRMMQALNRLRFGGSQDGRDEGFAAVFIATVGPDLRYASAGHDTALIVNGRTHRHLAPTGPLVGVIPDASFADCTTGFGVDDLLLIATDGFTECRSEREGAQFGTAGITRALAGTSDRSPESACRAVTRSSDAFTGERYRDDATLAAIARRTAP